MKTTLIFTISLVAVSCSYKQKSDLITKQDTTMLKNLKEVLWPKSYHEHDAALLDEILHDEFKMIDNEGGWSDKSGEMEWVKSSTFKPDSFYYEIKRLDIFDNGTAIIAGTGHILNDSSETTYESSNVLIRQDGAWKAISSHVSGVKKLE